MEETLKQDIQKAIEHSGFPLEHYTYNVLRKYGWSVITNRYYIDDLRGIERKVDLVAYKIHQDEVEKIQYITSLIISCKRSENKTWCFLTRDVDINDGNFDWSPLHICTTDSRLEYMAINHRDIIVGRYKSNIAVREIYDFKENIFAYEQLRVASNENERKQKGNMIVCGNDDIYNSITTTIKAVEYEKLSRLERYKQHKYKRFYTFHILSIFDGSMIKDYINEDEEHCIEEVQAIKYLNRHIVNNTDNFYIVNFIRKDHFDNRIQIFNNIHSENERTLPKLLTSFYENIFEDRHKAQIMWKEFSDSIVWKVRSILIENGAIAHSEDVDLSYIYDKKAMLLEIGIDLSFVLPQEEVQELNTNKSLNDLTRKYLKKIYRYTDNFTFTDGLPF